MELDALAFENEALRFDNERLQQQVDAEKSFARRVGQSPLAYTQSSQSVNLFKALLRDGIREMPLEFWGRCANRSQRLPASPLASIPSTTNCRNTPRPSSGGRACHWALRDSVARHARQERAAHKAKTCPDFEPWRSNSSHPTCSRRPLGGNTTRPSPLPRPESRYRAPRREQSDWPVPASPSGGPLRCLLYGSVDGGAPSGAWRAGFQNGLAELLALILSKVAGSDVAISVRATAQGSELTARVTVEGHVPHHAVAAAMQESFLDGSLRTLAMQGQAGGLPGAALRHFLLRPVSVVVLKTSEHHEWLIPDFESKLGGHGGAAVLVSEPFAFGGGQSLTLHLHPRGQWRPNRVREGRSLSSVDASLSIFGAGVDLPQKSFLFSVGRRGCPWAGPFGREGPRFLPGGVLCHLDELLASTIGGALLLVVEAVVAEAAPGRESPHLSESLTESLPLLEGTLRLLVREGPERQPRTTDTMLQELEAAEAMIARLKAELNQVRRGTTIGLDRCDTVHTDAVELRQQLTTPLAAPPEPPSAVVEAPVLTQERRDDSDDPASSAHSPEPEEYEAAAASGSSEEPPVRKPSEPLGSQPLHLASSQQGAAEAAALRGTSASELAAAVAEQVALILSRQLQGGSTSPQAARPATAPSASAGLHSVEARVSTRDESLALDVMLWNDESSGIILQRPIMNRGRILTGSTADFQED